MNRVALTITPDFWISRIYPEGILERWLIENGAHVEAGQLVALLNIESRMQELKAPAAGRLSIEARQNNIIEPGAVIGHIEAV